jgi:hypothetical protein
LNFNKINDDSNGKYCLHLEISAEFPNPPILDTFVTTITNDRKKINGLNKIILSQFLVDFFD